MKRTDCLSWDEYFMNIALLSAMRSKDPNTQVGACIVKNKRIVGTGYNGMPGGYDEFPWKREGGPLDTKYLFVVHAENNAILSCDINRLDDSTLYTTLFPCNECAKAIAQVGIKKIYYLEDKYKHDCFTIAAKQIFDKLNIQYEEFIPNRRLQWKD